MHRGRLRTAAVRSAALRRSKLRTVAPVGGGSQLLSFDFTVSIDPTLAAGSTKTTTVSRASAAFQESLGFGQVRRYTQLANDVARRDARRDSKATIQAAGVNNGFTYSEDLTQASWTKTRVAIDSATSVAFGSETANAHGLVADATGSTHYIATSLTPPSPFKHVFSAYVKAGSKSWCYLKSNNQGSNDVYAYFDLANTALGTAHAEVLNSAIEDVSATYGTGWRRISMTYDGGTLNHAHEVHAADGDGDINYSGDGATVQLYVYGLQHDYTDPTTGVEEPRSYVRTTGNVRYLGPVRQGLRCEDAATSYVPTTVTGYSTANVGIAANAVSPTLAANSAYTITDTAVNDVHLAYSGRSDTPANGTATINCVMLKAGTLAHAVVEAQFGVSAISYSGVVVDLTTGAMTPYSAGTNPAVTGEAIDIGDGWWIVCLKALWDGVTGTNKVLAFGPSNGSRSYLGTGAGTILAWMPQALVGSKLASPVIVGAAASATRLADAVTIAADDGNAADGRGRLTVVASADADATSAGWLAALDDGVGTDEIVLDATSDQYAELAVTDGGVVQAGIVDDDALTTERTVVARWATDRFSLSTDGVQAPSSPDISGTPPAIADTPTLRIGRGYADGTAFQGLVKSVNVRNK